MARQATVIPVWGELLADLDTPVSAFLKLDDGRYSFLLESVEGEERVARFSFLGSRPRLLFKSLGRNIELIERVSPQRLVVRRYHTTRDPLAEIEGLMRRFHVAPTHDLPRFYGGLVGYLGYNTVQFIERLPAHQRDSLQVPDMMLMLADSMVIVDHAQHKMLLVVNAMTGHHPPGAVYQQCVAQIRAMARQLASRPRLHGMRRARDRIPERADQAPVREEFPR